MLCSRLDRLSETRWIKTCSGGDNSCVLQLLAHSVAITNSILRMWICLVDTMSASRFNYESLGPWRRFVLAIPMVWDSRSLYPSCDTMARVCGFPRVLRFEGRCGKGAKGTV